MKLRFVLMGCIISALSVILLVLLAAGTLYRPRAKDI